MLADTLSAPRLGTAASVLAAVVICAASACALHCAFGVTNAAIALCITPIR